MDELIERVRRRVRADGCNRRPVPPAELERAEARLGFPLPPTLRAIYLNVADGGFGPGYGLLPLLDAEAGVAGESVVELYLSFCLPDPDDSEWHWPQCLLPINDWGCAIRSCVDVASPEESLISFVPGGIGAWQGSWRSEPLTLQQWLAAWLDGKLRQPEQSP